MIRKGEGAEASRKTSYGDIVKSSILIGGSAALSMGVSIVRTKALALLLGPSGVGLIGLYWSITDFMRTVAGLGINNSGVRQIAEAVGTGDTTSIARTVTILRRVAFVLGALGALLMVVFCRPIAQLTFGNTDHTGPVALLSLVVFCGSVMAGQGALLRGMRRVADIARLNVLGAVLGAAISITIIYLYGEPGVVPALVAGALMSVVTSWWYARKVKVDRVTVTMNDMREGVSALLKLGLVFTASTILIMGTAYAIRTMVLRHFGVEAAGYYHAAWAFGGIYVGFILQAMGADFFPRLTAAAKDPMECNRLMNEQAEVGLLLAGPGALATLALAPWVIHLFYTAQFSASIELLRWNCLGMLLRVAAWPLSFVLVARNEAGLFFWTELINSIVQIALTWVCLQWWGLTGAGVAFCATYVIYWLGICLVVRRLTGFRWSRENRRLGLLLVSLTGVVFGAWYEFRHGYVMAFGIVASLGMGIYSLRTLSSLVPLERFPRFAQRLVLFFQPAKPGPNL